MTFSKFLKWSASFVRLMVLKIGLGSNVSWPHGGKPVYIGRGARIRVADGGRLRIGQGLYLSENCLIQVNPEAEVSLGEHVFMNANSRVVSAKSVEVGDNSMFGPNVCVYDHDHVIGCNGVSAELVCDPVSIGSSCWIGANSVVTKGVVVASKIAIGGGAVVTRSLTEMGVYAGVPARLVSHFAAQGGCVNDESSEKTLAPQLGNITTQMAPQGGGSITAGQAEKRA